MQSPIAKLRQSLHPLFARTTQTPALQRFWSRVRSVLYPFELYTVMIVVISVLFLRLHGLRVDWRTVEYTIYPMFKMLRMALVVGLSLQIGYHLLLTPRSATLLQPRSWLVAGIHSVISYFRRVATLGWPILWFRVWFASMLMTYAYFWLKVCIPLINYRLWDEELWQLDTLLHLGLSPTIFITTLFQDTPLVGFIDWWYGLWVMSVIWTISFFSASTEPRFRRRFMLSCVVLWTTGAWLYMSMPALGPIYVFPDLFEPLREAMPRAEGGQLELWLNYEKMLAGRTGMLSQFNPTRGIAAMPSVHVGAHWLFALWARRAARPLYLPFLIGALLTLVGSVLTGWHYAVDGYVGIALAYLAFWIAHRLDREPALQPSTDEADAGDGATD